MPTGGHRHKIRKVRNIRLSDGKQSILTAKSLDFRHKCRKVLLSIDEKMVQTIFVSGQNREMWVSPECWGKDKQSLCIKGTTRIMVSHITMIKKI